MLNINGKITHFVNAKAISDCGYPDELKEIVSVEKSVNAINSITTWPGYSVTPLHALTSLASSVNVKQIWYKDESQRFGLKSFKALGGAYAVARQLQMALQNSLGYFTSISELLEGKWKNEVAELVVSCATDGNHGRSVAWGAQMFGCGCVIYIHSDVSEGRKEVMEFYGAKVTRVDGNYDESVRVADADAKIHNRIIVSDTTYAGYMEIPKDVALGYTVMLSEIAEQLEEEIPTHIFIQGGVGGLASAVSGYFWDLWGVNRPRLIVVEPETANCLQQSARVGEPVAVGGDHKTLMAGLACGEVSLLAWDILKLGADDFMTLSEEAIGSTMSLLARGYKQDPAIEAGESAVPGLAALILASRSCEYAKALGLNAESKVLIFGTEGATDPEVYERLVN